MRCSTVLPLLDDHLDGLLPTSRSAEIRAHLDSCGECDGEAELLRSVTTPLSSWGDLEAPPGCFERILERIDALPADAHIPAPPPPPASAFQNLRFLRGGARWFVTSGAAAAAVLVAAAALDGGGLEYPSRDRPRAAESAPGVHISEAIGRGGIGPISRLAVRPTTTRRRGLKDGERPLTRSHGAILVTDDLEYSDGVRRRRASDLPGELVVPVSADPFGESPR